MRTAAITMAGVALALSALAAQDAAPKKAAAIPRTPDGRPELQGRCTTATITTIERPANHASQSMTAEEAARLEKGVVDRVERLSQPSDPNRTAPPKGGDGSTGAAGNVGGYNNFWIDAGDKVAIVNGERPRPLGVGPPDGKGPPRTPGGAPRQAERKGGSVG